MESPIRILHVVVNMNRGGAETLLMNLYRHLNKTKIQFDFLTFKPGVFDEEIVEMGGKVHRIPYVSEVGSLRFQHRLHQFLQENREYKIIHSHMDKMSGLILKYAKQANIPIRIAHSHNTESEGGYVKKLYKWYIGSHILKCATHLYACSEKAAKWLYGNQAQQGVLLKNGIDTDQFIFSKSIRETVRNELNIKEGAITFGHVGRFSHQKNHLFLLDVFAALQKRIPESELVLVGDGPLKEDMRKKIQLLNLENNVKLLGVRSDIPRLLQAFDVFMMPSFHEGLPVTLIEAQGAGLPCIISDTITKEVDMGMDLVHFLSLTEKEAWLDAMTRISTETPRRKISATALSKKGYDIKETAASMEGSYMAMMLGEEAI